MSYILMHPKASCNYVGRLLERETAAPYCFTTRGEAERLRDVIQMVAPDLKDLRVVDHGEWLKAYTKWTTPSVVEA